MRIGLQVRNPITAAFELLIVGAYSYKDSLQVQLMDQWKQHVQQGLQEAANRYAHIRLSQAGEIDDVPFDAFKVPFFVMAGFLISLP